MKRVLLLFLLLMCLCGLACADVRADDAALQVMLEQHPDYAVLSSDQCGYTAAAVLGHEASRVLCVAEQIGGAWSLTISNKSALPAGAEVSLFLDTDNALFWRIGNAAGEAWETWHYSAFRDAEGWGQVNCIRMHLTDGQTIVETSFPWENGILREVREYRDENENLLERALGPAIPAAWLGSYLPLENYDASVVPVPQGADYPGSWLQEDALRRCLQELMPEYTYAGGAATKDGLELLARDPAGRRRMVACSCVDSMPVTSVSAPLPEDVFYGWDNFWECLAFPGQAAAAVRPFADGVWGVDYTWPMQDGGESLFFGRNWIRSENDLPGSRLYIGDHPWSDLSTPWSTLPSTLEEALAELDPGRWAVVNNPAPADRLHLREEADKTSRSLGKYYNGTPVEVLEKGSSWSRVRIQDMTGWMMSQYLAFGRDGWEVRNAFPQLHFSESAASFPVWRSERVRTGQLAPEGDWMVEKGESFRITGVWGEEWYHVWFPERDESGLMRRSDFWEGNG